MLDELRSGACQEYRSPPYLGPILEDFDDWLRLRGYALSTRSHYLWLTKHVDRYLREHYRGRLSELSAEGWAECQRWLRTHDAPPTPVVSLLREYLEAKGQLAASMPKPSDPITAWIERYAEYLGKLRGLQPKTIKDHSFTAVRFLEELSVRKHGLVPSRISITDIESFIAKSASGRCRATMQHVVAHVRGFLRFLEMSEHMSPGLGSQIDTARVYRLEQLPRALGWDVVEAILRSIDRRQPVGRRDYAMFSLMAQYGLRCSEVVALQLGDLQWRSRRIVVSQRKTRSALVLPLTDLAGAALYEYLRRGRRACPAHREVFLACRAPYLPLGPTAVGEAFRARLRRSGLDIPLQGPHCLRHSYAVHLLRQGTSLKEIGDLLGHRLAESTSMYLRLAVEDLREVALPLPHADGRRVE